MADVQRYQDPATGSIYTLTEADAKARGYTLYEGKQEGGGASAPAPAPAGEPAAASAPVEAEAESEAEYPRHVGGGMYELSSGERVRGKDEAQEAEMRLQGQVSAPEPEPEPNP